MWYQRIQRTAYPGVELMPGRNAKGNLADLDSIEQRLNRGSRPETGCLPVNRRFLQIGRPCSTTVRRHRRISKSVKLGGHRIRIRRVCHN